MNLKNLFRRATPAEKRERAILNQFRNQPFHLLQWCLRLAVRRHCSAVIAAGERNAWTACQRAARRQRRRTAKPTRSANAWNALKKKGRHCRRHCRVRRHHLQTHLCRWLAVTLLCWLLRLVLWVLALHQCLCRGNRSCSTNPPSCSPKSPTAGGVIVASKRFAN